MTGTCICRPGDPEGWYREDCPTHGRKDETPPPCLNCGCPWNSCLIHGEFCCDACAHFPAWCACGHIADDHDPDDGCGACAMAMVGPCRTFRPQS